MRGYVTALKLKSTEPIFTSHDFSSWDYSEKYKNNQCIGIHFWSYFRRFWHVNDGESGEQAMEATSHLYMPLSLNIECIT